MIITKKSLSRLQPKPPSRRGKSQKPVTEYVFIRFVFFEKKASLDFSRNLRQEEANPKNRLLSIFLFGKRNS